MNDLPRLPDLDDRLLDAVSAVVDDVADADERALVAASAEAQQWVEHLRGLADEVAELASISPPAEIRESALAAALAAFDDLQAPAPVEVTTPAHDHVLRTAVAGTVDRVVSLAEHRRRRSRWLLSAAAAVVVVAGAGIAIQANRHSDDEVADSAATVTAAATDAAAEKSAPSPLEATLDTGAPAGAAPAAAEETQAATEAASDDAYDSTGADTAADTEAATEMVTPTIAVIPGPAEIGRAIGSADELATFVAAAVGLDVESVPATTEGPAATQAPAATEAPAETEAPAGTTATGGGSASCVTGGQILVGPISYLGTSAVAVYDPTDGTAIAYDATDCRLLASLPLG